MTAAGVSLRDALRSHERFLWGLCYRMTGVPADADDLVQETFARALATPPRGDGRSLRPWLTRVAVNAARDLLRQRRRTAYRGPWLPGPIETGEAEEPPALEPEVNGSSPAERYEQLESVSFAFLLALEALSPKQRAVLLLRDVFDYPVAEVAEMLGMSAGNVKVVHHRARAKLGAYDARRELDRAGLTARNRQALEKLMTAVLSRDAAAVERLLTEDVILLSDGAGEYLASMVPLVGPDRVGRFMLRLAEIRTAPSHLDVRSVNGQPSIVLEVAPLHPKEPPRSVVSVDTDAQGRIRAVYLVVASRKLTAIRFPRVG